MSINIVVPEVGESIVDARVARWLKKEGDAVAPASRSSSSRRTRWTSKCRRQRPACCSTIAHGDGADVKIGDVLGTIEEGRGYGGRRERRSTEIRRRHGNDGATAGTPTSATTNGKGGTGTAAATPSARKLAREQNVPT